MDLELRWKYWHAAMDMYSIEYITWEKRQWEALVSGWPITYRPETRREGEQNG